MPFAVCNHNVLEWKSGV